MADGDASQNEAAEVRRRAEALWRQQPPPPADGSSADAQHVLHELEVHQIELEMQNAELRRAQEELASSHARFFDLFDLAPVGYLTLDVKGGILEANLAAGSLLGVERSPLVGQPLTRFICRDDQDVYHLHHKRLLRTHQAESCELRLQRRDEVQMWVRLQSVLAEGREGGPVCRVTLSDISERKQAEDQNRLLTFRLVDAQEEERRALARDLHDGAGQVLTSMLLALGVLARDAADNPDITERLQKLRLGIESLMSELHALSANLYPPSLTRAGLVGALRGALDSLQDTSGPQLRLQTWGLEGRRLPPTHEIAVYRVAQEAINNALRHAHASSIDVVLQVRDDRLVVTIEDDGVGFDADAAHLKANGLGLMSMSERTEMLGGRLTIESKPGAGTTVYVDVPL